MARNMVGALQFLTVKRPTAPPAEVPEDITRPNVDGVAFRKTGQRGETYQLIATVDLVTSANVKAMIDAAAALCGTVVTIIDDIRDGSGNGTSWTLQLIHAFRVVTSHRIEGAVGGINGTSAKFMLVIEFEVRDTRRNPAE